MGYIEATTCADRSGLMIYRMFIPVDDSPHGSGQHIWIIDKDENGQVHKKKEYGVNYVPLTDPPK